MIKIKNVYRIISEPETRFLWLTKKGRYNTLTDYEYLNKAFKVRMGYNLDLENPKTFNEKLQWLKLYDRKPIYTKMVDKHEAKIFVEKEIGSQYVIPEYGVWDHFSEIDFDVLPRQFVLKCTHDSGGISICKNKKEWDQKAAESILNRALKRDFYNLGKEWPYKNVKRQILAEKYMEDSVLKELWDYKFFCFNGKVKCYKVDWGRFHEHHANYYSPDGHLLELGETLCPPVFSAAIEMPQNLLLMETLAEHMSYNIPFLRVDFYEVDGKVFFGEFTFYPASGFGKFLTPEQDLLLGNWLQLPPIDS